MSIVENEPLLQPFEIATRLFTAADLELLPTDLPSGPIDFELDNGRLVFIMVPPGDIHGAVQVNIATQLKVQGEFKRHGKARTEVGVILWRRSGPRRHPRCAVRGEQVAADSHVSAKAIWKRFRNLLSRSAARTIR